MHIAVNNLNKDNWTKFLKEHSHSHIWHSWEWGEYLAHFRNRQVLRCAIFNKMGTVIGLHTMILAPTFPIGTLADSIPMYHFSGPILRSDLTLHERNEAHMQLANFLSIELKRRRTVYFTMRIWESDLVEPACLKQWLNAGYRLRQGQTFKYLLPEDESTIARRYDHDFRNQVRQGSKRGGTVEINSPIDARTIYKLYIKSMAEAGERPRYSYQEVAFMLNMNQRNLRDIYICKYQGQSVAFAICLKFNNTAIYWLAGMDRRFREVRPMNLIIDKFLTNSLNQHIHRIDIGGAGEEGLYHFKRSIGAEPTSVFSLTRTYSHLFYLHRPYQAIRTYMNNLVMN